MYRLYEKRDNQPVSMIFENPKSGESFTQFIEMIKKSSTEKILKSKGNRKDSRYIASYNMYSGGEGGGARRPKSLIGASTMGSPKKLKKSSKKEDSAPQVIQSPIQILKPTVLGLLSVEINGSPLSTNLQFKSKIFRIIFSKKKFVFEFNLLINQVKSKGVGRDEELDNSKKVRLEVDFPKIDQMDIFSERNEVSLTAEEYSISEMQQESPKKPVYWEGTSLEVLRVPQVEGASEAQLKKIELRFVLSKDSRGKSLCARLSILRRLMLAGLSFSVDGRPQRQASGPLSLNMGQKFLPSRQDPKVRKSNKRQNRTSSVGSRETGFKEFLDKTEITALKKFESEIRGKTEEAKIQMIQDYVSYPKFSTLKDKNCNRCPIYDCFKPFQSANQLKSHITRYHKELQEFGVEVGNNFKIKWPAEKVDYVLRLIRYYPDFVIKHVKKVGIDKFLSMQ